MTQKEINILLEHGDIGKLEYPPRLLSEYSFEIDSLDGKDEYYISRKVLEVLKTLFEWYKNRHNQLNYRYEVENSLKYYSPIYEHQKDFLGKLIIDNYGKLRELCFKIDPVYGHGAAYPEMLRDVWIYEILEVAPHLLKILKFDILKGKRFDAFGMPGETYLPNFRLLDLFFLADRLRTVYDAIAIKDKIEYLQKRVGDMENHSKNNIGKSSQGRKSKPKPKGFEDIFYNPKDAEYALISLRQITPRVINEENDFIGKNKGIFPMWVDILRNYKSGIIKTDISNDAVAYALNSKIKGLNIDGSIFSKTYKKLDREDIEHDIKSILSVFSVNGKS